MSLVDSETGEIVHVLDAAEARILTDRIKVTIEGAWHLITEAYQARAWVALGYSSWDDYCTREFGSSRLRLPREDRQEVVASLRESGLSIRAIAAATGNSYETTRRALPTGDSFESPDPEFAELAGALDDTLSRHPSVPEVEPRFKPSVKPMKPPASKVTGIDGKSYAAQRPDRTTEIVREVVAEEQQKQQQRAEDREAIRQLNAEAEAAGLDIDPARQAERGRFVRLCRDLADMPRPAEFLARHQGLLTERHFTQADRAYAWLDEFMLERGEDR